MFVHAVSIFLLFFTCDIYTLHISSGSEDVAQEAKRQDATTMCSCCSRLRVFPPPPSTKTSSAQDAFVPLMHPDLISRPLERSDVYFPERAPKTMAEPQRWSGSRHDKDNAPSFFIPLFSRVITSHSITPPRQTQLHRRSTRA